MAFYDAFFGSDQSLYTAYAIIAAIIAICITILLTATDISVGNRILIVLFVIVTLIPSIFLTLFEITCMVTGGTEPNRWWCYAFAWILAAFIIIYCVFVVIISLISLFTYNNAIDNLNEAERKSNHIAKQIIHSEEENFYNAPQTNEQFGGNFNRDAQIKCTLNKDKYINGVCISKFENRENFGAEPLNELTSDITPPPESFENQNEEFLNQSNVANFTNPDESFENHTEGFESYDGNSKAYFSDFGLNGASDLINNLKDNAKNSFNASFGSNF